MKHSIMIGGTEPYGTVLVDVLDEFWLRGMHWFVHLSYENAPKSNHKEYILSEWGTGMRVTIKDKHFYPISTSLTKFKEAYSAYIMSKSDEEITKAMKYGWDLVKRYREPDLITCLL